MTRTERILHLLRSPQSEDIRVDLDNSATGECLLCEQRAQIQLAAEDESALLCFEHIGDFVEIWSGERRSFTLEKLV